MNITQGSIVLTPFPFSDQKSAKLRPALVISSNEFNTRSKDVWLSVITSKECDKNFKVPLSQTDLVAGKLYMNSYIKFSAVTAAEKTTITKVVGRVNQKKVTEVIKGIVGILVGKKV